MAELLAHKVVDRDSFNPVRMCECAFAGSLEEALVTEMQDEDAKADLAHRALAAIPTFHNAAHFLCEGT